MECKWEIIFFKAEQMANEVIHWKKKQVKIMERWDSKIAERIAEIISLKLL